MVMKDCEHWNAPSIYILLLLSKNLRAEDVGLEMRKETNHYWIATSFPLRMIVSSHSCHFLLIFFVSLRILDKRSGKLYLKTGCKSQPCA